MTLGFLIKHFGHESNTSQQDAYMLATAVVVMAILQAIVGHHSNFGQLEIGMRLRIACSSLIYRKVSKIFFLIITSKF